MIQLGQIIGLKPINEAEVFTATSKETGTTSVFKSKAARDAAIKAGTHEKRKGDKDGAVQEPGKKDTPKVNIFKKDKEEPKRDSATDAQIDDVQNNIGDLDGDEIRDYAESDIFPYLKGRDLELAKMYVDDIDAAGDDFDRSADLRKDLKDLFDKKMTLDSPKEEPKKDDSNDISQPNSVEGTGQADPKVNKQVRKIADKMGISSKKLGKEEYEKKMAQAAVEALTDSNFHTEARWLVADLEGKPELRERPNYPKFDDPDYEKKMDAVREKYASQYADDVDDDARNLGIEASQAAGWGGATAMESIVFDLKMSGSHKLANKILKSFKDAQQKQEGRISIGDMMEDVINEGPSTEEKRIAMLAVRKQAKYRSVSLEQAIQDQINALEDLKRDAKRGKIK